MHRADFFSDELIKVGFKITPGMGATLTAAAMGGAWQGDKGYQEARKRGEGVGSSLLSGLGRGAKGVLGGAAIGGAAAMGAKHLGGRVGGAAQTAQKSLHNLGGQQVHALTGYGGKGGARAFGGGSALTERHLDAARKAQKGLAKTYGSTGGVNTRWRKWRTGNKATAVSKAVAGDKSMRKAEDMGLTSLPGTIKSVREHGARKSLRAAWDSQAKGMGTGQKAMLFGLPAVFGVAGALGGEKGKGGESVGEAAGMAASNVLPAAMTPSMLGAFSPAAHLMPTYLMSRPFMEAGKQVGKGVDWARAKVKGGGEQ